MSVQIATSSEPQATTPQRPGRVADQVALGVLRLGVLGGAVALCLAAWRVALSVLGLG